MAAARTIKAKFATSCGECGYPIERGEQITKRDGQWAHAEPCYDAEAAAEAQFFGQRERRDEIMGYNEATPYDHGAGGGDPDDGYY